MIEGRILAREEIVLLWEIDRREVIDNVYYYEDGNLVLRPEHYEMQGWPPGDVELYTPILVACFDRGGWFYGLFDDSRIVAMVVLESKFIGPRRDLLQLEQLHVSSDYRGRCLGRRLFELAKAEARNRGAKELYISATPSEHTINFYMTLGCRLTDCPDPVLLALEPDDIHLECAV